MLAGRQIFDEIRCNYRSFEISFRIVRVLIANFMIQILIAFTPSLSARGTRIFADITK